MKAKYYKGRAKGRPDFPCVAGEMGLSCLQLQHTLEQWGGRIYCFCLQIQPNAQEKASRLTTSIMRSFLQFFIDLFLHIILFIKYVLCAYNVLSMTQFLISFFSIYIYREASKPNISSQFRRNHQPESLLLQQGLYMQWCKTHTLTLFRVGTFAAFQL